MMFLFVCSCCYRFKRAIVYLVTVCVSSGINTYVAASIGVSKNKKNTFCLASTPKIEVEETVQLEMIRSLPSIKYQQLHKYS